MTWKLEKALDNIQYDQFDISEEVQEQVWVEKYVDFFVLTELELNVFSFRLLW